MNRHTNEQFNPETPERESVSRRHILRSASLLTGAAALGGTPLAALASMGQKPVSQSAKAMNSRGKPMKILVLGGTGFLGPKIVQAAIDRGHTVTLFNRGKTNPGLFPDLEKLVGDRYSDLSALKGREWDAVIDPFTYLPSTVRESAELLAPNIGHYLVISSISVYPAFPEKGMDESAPVATVPAEAIERIKSHAEVGQYYGGFKALCEQAAEEVMPGRTCSVRPGLIVGPGDMTNRFTWWPTRVRRGGEMIAPGKPGQSIQFINVTDLGEFIVTASEKKLKGAYNADSRPGTHTTGTMLDTCKRVTGSDTKLTWIEESFLAEQSVRGWQHLPAWVPQEGPYAGFGNLSVERAVAAGLTQRPLEETVRSTLKWFDEQPEAFRESIKAGFSSTNMRSAGIPTEMEARVLEAWHARDPG